VSDGGADLMRVRRQTASGGEMSALITQAQRWPRKRTARTSQ